MKKLLALLLILPVIASADPGKAPHLKKDNPDELQFHVAIGTPHSCPIKDVAIEDIVKGVFVRSRIKPVRWDANDPTDREFFLYVSLGCFELPKTENFAYSVNVGFGRWMSVGNWKLPVRHFISGNFGSIGIGHYASIRSEIQDGVESEITKFLKANFDLGEDDND